MRGLRLGLFLPPSLAAIAGGAVETPVWEDANVSDWTPVNVTLGVSADADPEVSAPGVSVRETVTDGNHFIYKEIPMLIGKTYRIRILVQSVSRPVITINLPTKWWIGEIGSTTPLAVSGMTDMTVSTAGDYTVMEVEFEHEEASGNIGFSIGICREDPLATVYPGDVAKGFDVGNVKLYDITASLPPFPDTAVSFPTGAGFQRTASGLAIGGVVGDFSMGMWVKITAWNQRYNSFFSIMDSTATGVIGKYFWLGTDIEAGETPGTRGLAFYDGQGGHAHQLLPLGTWIHIKMSKTGTTGRAWVNDTQCTWDTGTGDTFPCGQPEYNSINIICLGNEYFYEDSSWDGAMRAVYFKRGAMTLAEHQAQAVRSSPFLGDGDPDVVGGWPFATADDLEDALGGPQFTNTLGALGADVAGPAGITEP